MNYFITGIGTNVGKTVVSAILAEALEADYWKPVQSGAVEGTDSVFVKSMISNSKTVIHPEAYLLKEPLSPHFAAKLEGVEIEMEKVVLPARLSAVSDNRRRAETNENMIIEGAGGLLVPLNSTHYVIDIAKKYDCEIILVISNYLGCINHALLSIDYLVKHNFKIHALVFNGLFEEEVKNAIVEYVKNTRVITIPELSPVSKENVSFISQKIRQDFFA